MLYLSKCCTSGPPLPPIDDQLVDNDVLIEKNRIRYMTSANIKSTTLVISSMSKFYGKHLAVNQLSLGVQS